MKVGEGDLNHREHKKHKGKTLKSFSFSLLFEFFVV